MNVVDATNRAARRIPAWTIYIVCLMLAGWIFWQGAAGRLGPDPVKAIERGYGLWALKLLVAGLCITPLRRFTGLNLLKYRRAIGLSAFGFVVLHFLTWLVLDMGLLWGQILADIAKRPYVTVGMLGLLMLIPLAATSNDRALRRLGALRWRNLHKLTYLAALAGAIHYLWLVKAWPISPILYLSAVIALLFLRLAPKKPRVEARIRA